jgi:hypothetical protein
MFIIVESWPEPKYASVVNNPESGHAALFDSFEEAENSDEYNNCQNPYIFEI